MSNKYPLTYEGIEVCKADFDALTKLDKTKVDLDNRRMLTVSTLAENSVIEQKHLKLLEKFIDTTYPESIKAIEEEKREILKKYPKNNPDFKNFYSKIFSIIYTAIAVILFITATVYIAKAAL